MIYINLSEVDNHKNLFRAEPRNSRRKKSAPQRDKKYYGQVFLIVAYSGKNAVKSF
jgi:hypothetical protein